MSNDFKTFNMIGKYIDDTVGSLLSAWGAFTIFFISMIPVIFVVAAVKWLFENGYIS